MATLVLFHAHPDDESITTGGTAAKYAADGHRVVLVYATGGEHGEVPDDLGPDESIAERRRREVAASAAVLGAARIAWLGYEDSGMTGWEQNQNPAAFTNADVEEAAGRLAAILTEERADTVTIYDWHGNYGHPDHVKVHPVGRRAAEIAGTPHVYEATTNRDHIRRLMVAAAAAGLTEEVFDVDAPSDDGNPLGTPEEEITTAIDVREFASVKRASLACHASQVTDTAFFLDMPAEAFADAFGIEWFIHHGAPAGVHEDGLAGMT